MNLLWVYISEEDSVNTIDNIREHFQRHDQILYQWTYKYILKIIIIQYAYK